MVLVMSMNNDIWHTLAEPQTMLWIGIAAVFVKIAVGCRVTWFVDRSK